MSDHPDAAEIERRLVETYPDLALLLRRTASLHAWQPSEVGERVLRQLATGVAEVLERRLSPDAANLHLQAVIEATTAWLADERRDRGQRGTRSW